VPGVPGPRAYALAFAHPFFIQNFQLSAEDPLESGFAATRNF